MIAQDPLAKILEVARRIVQRIPEKGKPMNAAYLERVFDTKDDMVSGVFFVEETCIAGIPVKATKTAGILLSAQDLAALVKVALPILVADQEMALEIMRIAREALLDTDTDTEETADRL